MVSEPCFGQSWAMVDFDPAAGVVTVAVEVAVMAAIAVVAAAAAAAVPFLFF